MKFVLLTLILAPFFALSQSKRDGFDLNLSSLAIPQDLKKNAHTVFRLDEGVVDVSGPGRYSFKVHQIYTILNKAGSYRLLQGFGIDKFHKIEDVEIKVFNELGGETAKYKKKDFTVMGAYDGMSLVTDDKVMRLSIPASQFPITIEVKYTSEVSAVTNLESWFFQGDGVAVELSRFVVNVPENIDIRYKAKHIKIDPVISMAGSKKKYVWEAKNLIAKKFDEGAGQYAKYPRLLIGSNQFDFDGYGGNMSQWKGLGNWYLDLVKQTNQLAPKHKAEIQGLVAEASSDIEKIKLLYAHLQDNFRYVNISLGIGGFKPFPADFVHEKKYGDCKGLSNYMQACLNAVNIKSYSALINAGEDQAPVDPDFPYNGFNHVILCIPMKSDTVWLECTSKDVDFGHLSNFTENRNALVVTEDGGVLVPTPKSRSHQNSLFVTTTVDLNENGSGQIEGRFIAAGAYKYEQLTHKREKDDVKKKYFIDDLGFPNPDEFDVNFGERSIQPLKSSVKLTLEKVNDFAAGNKMFFKPRFCRLWSSKLPASDPRTDDFLFEYPFMKSDTTILKLPVGFVPDALPKTKDLTCDFASYQTRYWYDENQKAIYSTARLELKQHLIPAEKYSSVKSFFDEIIKDDAQRIVIAKK